MLSDTLDSRRLDGPAGVYPARRKLNLSVSLYTRVK